VLLLLLLLLLVHSPFDVAGVPVGVVWPVVVVEEEERAGRYGREGVASGGALGVPAEVLKEEEEEEEEDADGVTTIGSGCVRAASGGLGPFGVRSRANGGGELSCWSLLGGIGSGYVIVMMVASGGGLGPFGVRRANGGGE
jgi:hypothetical protein